MNNKGFSLIEMLGCIALLGIILCISLFVNRKTLATSMTTLNNISNNQIYNASMSYVMEQKVSWINYNNNEYTCISVNDLIDYGYLNSNNVSDYKDNIVKVEREPITKTINDVLFVDICE